MIWIIRWENGDMEAAGRNYEAAVAHAEKKSKENGMRYVIV